jgi:hypothetical protein
MVKKMGISAFNAGCIGASHIKAEKLCQDYSASWQSGKIAIAAVADGHGANIYSRSDRGARFAVESAFDCIRELIMLKTVSLPNPDKSLSALEKSIIAAWHEKIADDIRSEPQDSDGNAGSTGDIINSYGTTLLAAAMTGNYWFAIQIGDGKCVAFNEDSSISQPVPWDERCFLNQTTSLCDEDAGNIFRHFYSEKLPLAVFLGSDGIDDSFSVNKNKEHLDNFYSVIYKNFIREGLKKGKAELQALLPKLTQRGSGDDVSIAGILRGVD